LKNRVNRERRDGSTPETIRARPRSGRGRVSTTRESNKGHERHTRVLYAPTLTSANVFHPVAGSYASREMGTLRVQRVSITFEFEFGSEKVARAGWQIGRATDRDEASRALSSRGRKAPLGSRHASPGLAGGIRGSGRFGVPLRRSCSGATPRRGGWMRTPLGVTVDRGAAVVAFRDGQGACTKTSSRDTAHLERVARCGRHDAVASRAPGVETNERPIGE
jgi:hypothetical protein